MVEVVQLRLGGPPHGHLVSRRLQPQLQQGRGQLVGGGVTVGEEDADVEVAVEVLVFAQIREVVSEPLQVVWGWEEIENGDYKLFIS